MAAAGIASFSSVGTQQFSSVGRHRVCIDEGAKASAVKANGCFVGLKSAGGEVREAKKAQKWSWTATDWLEGAGGCFVERMGGGGGGKLMDWKEYEDSSFVEAWREPYPRAELDNVAGVSTLSGSPPTVNCSLAKQKGRKKKARSSKKREAAVHAAAVEKWSTATESPTLKFDFVVVGSGVAGLRYALAVAEKGTVAVVTKSEPHESNTTYAQGGVSAVLDPLDSIENHIRDTIVAGAYLCDEEVVEVVCREGPDRVRELMAMGATFDRGEDGQLHLAREGGHSHHRIVHAADVTGREIERALLTALEKNPNIQLFEHHVAVDLLTVKKGKEISCHGIDSLDVYSGQVIRFMAGSVLLASGGAGHVYPNTTNPMVATGDGVALAHRAGAPASNMEFVQFHPTALADEGLPIRPDPPRENAFLITEAVRGAGGILYNQAGERFMVKYDRRGELAPRDVVARSIDDQLKQRGEKFVWLDISHEPADEVIRHFPNIAAECLKYGLDITKEPIPVVPAAHYMCGGVQTGLKGETSIRGLFAAGEVACTGLHGANRLASNSLLEALVFAQRAVEPAIQHSLVAAEESFGLDEAKMWPRAEVPTGGVEEAVKATAFYRKRLQEVMWDYVGIVRSTERLEIAARELSSLEAAWRQALAGTGLGPASLTPQVCELRNLLEVAHLIVRSALQRHESRGLHYTTDFPQLVESQRLPTVLTYKRRASRLLAGK